MRTVQYECTTLQHSTEPQFIGGEAMLIRPPPAAIKPQILCANNLVRVPAAAAAAGALAIVRFPY